MAEPLLNTEEVAALLQMPVARFYRAHRELREQHGFPPRVPGCGYRWDPAAIDAWLARQRGESVGIVSLSTCTTPPDTGDAVAAWQVELDRRAAAMAASGSR